MLQLCFSVWVVPEGIQVVTLFIYNCSNVPTQWDNCYRSLKTRAVLYVFCCFCKIQIFWILSSWERYCGSNLLLPSGDNIMAPSADNRPPAHWWTPFNLPLFHFLKPAQSSPSSLSSGLRVKSSGAPKYDYFSAVCVRFTQKKKKKALYIFKAKHKWHLLLIVVDLMSELSLLQAFRTKFKLLQLP